MPVLNTTTDPDALTMTMTAHYAVSAARVWEVWADPRQLERWWGPPTYPATVHDHDLTPGGKVSYVMTGPAGEQHGGWWKVLAVDAPNRLEFEDGFADEQGSANFEMPVTSTVVTLVESEGGTTMTVTSHFPDREALEKLLDMGMQEGLTLAMGQIDALFT